ncbi:MAG: aa3-type cytochrome c oxidase subunit IV [Pseudomonadota bacterium]
MAEHKHGEMDITSQEKTFEGFMNLTTKATIVIVVALVLLAIFAS